MLASTVLASTMRAGTLIRRILVTLVGVSLLPTVTAAMPGPESSRPVAAAFPLTTKSPEARRLVDQALVLDIDHVQIVRAIEILRRAVKIDPQFAMGHELLARISLDSAEQVSEQQKAFSTRHHASPSERTVIEWFQEAADHKLIPAIIKMNDVVSRYPHDKTVVWLAILWLESQAQFERVLAIYENSRVTNSPGLLNEMAYSYAALRRFDQAIALMDKYAIALPGDPNPEDSYAEILRLAGHFDESIGHYRAALAIDPKFYTSQFGIGDTYSLMGDQVRARKEYKIGFEKFSLEELERVQWQMREATTFVREGDLEGADRAFQVLADSAHDQQISQVEADTYRQMAIYQPDPKKVLALLDKADAALSEGKTASKSAIQQESAQILRARVELAARTGQKDAAHLLLTRLASMSESSADKLIERAYHGAVAAVLYSERNYSEAIAHLQEDTVNPLSLELLAGAYQGVGNRVAAERTADTLAGMNEPTLEQAVVVLAFRKCQQDSSCGGNLKNVSLKQ
jgi:tetratricopeptide (TPR) repeat protein